MRSVTNNGDSNWRKLLLTESACSQLSSNTQSTTSTSFIIIIMLAIYAKYTGLDNKPLSSRVTLSKSYKYLLKRVNYNWTNKELFLPCQYYYFKLWFDVLNNLSNQRSLDCRQPIFSWGQKLLFWEVSREARRHNVGVFIAHVTLSCATSCDWKQTSSSFSKLYKIPSPSRQFTQQMTNMRYGPSLTNIYWKG